MTLLHTVGHVLDRIRHHPKPIVPNGNDWDEWHHYEPGGGTTCPNR